jgi:hypothetical protein
MKHIRQISTPKADAFIDFYNALFRAWVGFRDDKKNEAQSGF